MYGPITTIRFNRCGRVRARRSSTFARLFRFVSLLVSSPPATSSPAEGTDRVHGSLALRDAQAPQRLAVRLARSSAESARTCAARRGCSSPHGASGAARAARAHRGGVPRFDVHRGGHMVGAACDFDVRVRSCGLGASPRGAL